MTASTGPKTRNHLRRHSKQRSDERLHRNLTRRDFQRFVRAIELGQATFLFQQSVNTSFWRLCWDDLTFIAIFDHQRRALRTIYDEALFENAIATGRVPHPSRWASLTGAARRGEGNAKEAAASALADEDWEALMMPAPAAPCAPRRPAGFTWKEPHCMELAKRWMEQDKADAAAALAAQTPATEPDEPTNDAPTPDAPTSDALSLNAPDEAPTGAEQAPQPELAPVPAHLTTGAPAEITALVQAARALTPDVLRAAALLGALDGPLQAEWTWVQAAPASLRSAAQEAFAAQLSAHVGEDPDFTAAILAALP